MAAPRRTVMVCFATTLELLLLTVGSKTLFHGTSEANCQKILNDGFIPSLDDGRSYTHYGEGVYFTPIRGRALDHARNAQRTESELWCSESGYFCSSSLNGSGVSSAELGACLISLNIDLAGSRSGLISSANWNFDTFLDFTKSPSGREYVFKRQGLQKHEGATLTFLSLSSRQELSGQLKLNSDVFFELGNRVHARKLSELLATGTHRDTQHCVTCYMASPMLLTQPSLQALNVLLERASVALGCSMLECGGGVLASAMTALDEAGALVGGVAGAAIGAVVFHHVVSELMGSGCTRCAHIAALVGGFVGLHVAMPQGAQLGASLAQWFSNNVAGRILDFLHNLTGVKGRHAAFRELDLLWSPSPSCAVIRQRRRSLMLHWHPDLCNSEECQEKAVRINAAFVKLAQTCVEQAHDHSDELDNPEA